jgi:heme/copper-type cytochrome/quinol oxidase subunit 4
MTIIVLLIGLYAAAATQNVIVAIATLAIVQIFLELKISWIHMHLEGRDRHEEDN